MTAALPERHRRRKTSPLDSDAIERPPGRVDAGRSLTDAGGYIPGGLPKHDFLCAARIDAPGTGSP
jgi:hypothetical protein